MSNVEFNKSISNNIIGNNYDIINDSTGKCNSEVNSFSVTERNENELNKHSEPNNNININIYRYKFTDDFTGEMFTFSKIHQYDHRKDFKEAWNIWLEDNDDIVTEEVRRLTNLSYDGDILDKMFKSARYYFRKKSTEKKEPTKRCVYVGIQKQLIDSMDTHIKSKINDEDYKPSDGFNEFCKINVELLKEEVNILCKNGFTDSTEIKNKIKKAYKNRYFSIISK
jgi:hypothetical protein